MKGYIPGGVSPDVRITIGGKLVTEAALPREETGMFSATFELGPEVPRTSPVTITIRPGGTFVPKERGMNEDDRHLSYKLKRLGLE